MKGRSIQQAAWVFVTGFMMFLPLIPGGGSCSANVSLDDFLSTLETNGVLSDRSRAVKSGMEGILRSIDPDAALAGDGVEGAKPGPGRAMEAVEFWPEDMAYLKVGNLVAESGIEILAHCRALNDKAGLILDLRGAGGDDLPSVVALSGMAYEAGEPVFVVMDNQDKVLSTNVVETAVRLRTPIMVLVDHRTRGAAEALVAVWKGRPGIMLVGAGTTGNASIRDLLMLPDGRKVKIATRKLVFPGVAYHAGLGIAPDVLVNPAPAGRSYMLSSTNPPPRALSQKSEQDLELMARVENDVVLRRATDILLGLRALGGYGKR